MGKLEEEDGQTGIWDALTVIVMLEETKVSNEEQVDMNNVALEAHYKGTLEVIPATHARFRLLRAVPRGGLHPDLAEARGWRKLLLHEAHPGDELRVVVSRGGVGLEAE